MSEAADALSERIEALIGHRPGVTRKRMFGGVCYMLWGNMIGGAMKLGSLLLRVGNDGIEPALARGAERMTMGERTMGGFVEVPEDAIADEHDLRSWLDTGLAAASALPRKAESATAPRKSSKRPAG